MSGKPLYHGVSLIYASLNTAFIRTYKRHIEKRKEKARVGPSSNDFNNPTFFVYNDGHFKPSLYTKMLVVSLIIGPVSIAKKRKESGMRSLFLTKA